MRKVLTFSLFLLVGLAVSQILPQVIGEAADTVKTASDMLLYICLDFRRVGPVRHPVHIYRHRNLDSRQCLDYDSSCRTHGIDSGVRTAPHLRHHVRLRHPAVLRPPCQLHSAGWSRLPAAHRRKPEKLADGQAPEIRYRPRSRILVNDNSMSPDIFLCQGSDDNSVE
jgi:hypothetical protein